MTENEMMTPEQCSELMGRLHANWTYMNFTDEKTFELWYSMLRPYRFSTMSLSVNEWIRNQQNAPTVADIINGYNAIASGLIQKKERQFKDRIERGELKCDKCKGKGFIKYIFPTKIDSIKFCDCEVGRRMVPSGYEYKFPEPYDDITSEIYYGVKFNEFRKNNYVKKPALIPRYDKNGVLFDYTPYTASVVWQIEKIGG